MTLDGAMELCSAMGGKMVGRCSTAARAQTREVPCALGAEGPAAKGERGAVQDAGYTQGASAARDRGMDAMGRELGWNFLGAMGGADLRRGGRKGEQQQGRELGGHGMPCAGVLLRSRELSAMG